MPGRPENEMRAITPDLGQMAQPLMAGILNILLRLKDCGRINEFEVAGAKAELDAMFGAWVQGNSPPIEMGPRGPK